MVLDKQIEKKFWRIFKRVLGPTIELGQYSVDDLVKWDSLNHVELIFELEESFDIDIPADDIAKLYTDTTTILLYLNKSLNL